MKTILVLVLFFVASCYSSKKTCIRKSIKNSKYAYIKDGDIDNTRYFVIKNSRHEEYEYNKLYAISNIKWESCNKYYLIIQDFFDHNDEGLKKGDTLQVDLISVEKDTFTCIGSSLGFSTTIQFCKIE